MTTPTSPEPVAWLHILHMEHEAERTLTFTPDNPFGRRGRDYSESFWTEHIALVIAAAPAPPVPEGLEATTARDGLLFWHKLALTAAGHAHLLQTFYVEDGKAKHLPEALLDAAIAIDRLQAALAGARGAALEEALAVVQKQRDTAAGHDGDAYLAGTYNGLDQACEIIRALIPEPVSAPPEADYADVDDGGEPDNYAKQYQAEQRGDHLTPEADND